MEGQLQASRHASLHAGAHKLQGMCNFHVWGKAEHSNVGAATNNDVESQIRQVCVHWLLILRSARSCQNRMQKFNAATKGIAGKFSLKLKRKLWKRNMYNISV